MSDLTDEEHPAIEWLLSELTDEDARPRGLIVMADAVDALADLSGVDDLGSEHIGAAAASLLASNPNPYDGEP